MMARLGGEPRTINLLLAELCAERNIPYLETSYGWLVQMGHAGRCAHVFGFSFSLNSATASRIAEDKAATCECLRVHAVPAVEHRLILSPALRGRVAEDWSAARALESAFAAFGEDVVVKENGGSGGVNVVRARTTRELEAAALQLFSRFHAVAVSPFLLVAEETRVYVAPVHGTVHAVLVYSKQRPVAEGDGVSTVRALQARISEHLRPTDAVVVATGRPLGPDDVPDAGVSVVLHWKHNLGGGALPLVHYVHGALGSTVPAVTHPATPELCELALRAARALDLRFGAVDIVAVHGAEPRLRVLEINGGVMVESFARMSTGHRRLAKAIYALALDEVFR